MRVKSLASATVLVLALAAGPALSQQNVDKVFGGITAESGQEYGSLDSVNGGITIRRDARVRSASTVNGGISLAEGARVGQAETVNGGISLDEGAEAEQVETVNGGITLGKRARVVNDVEAVNGGIRLQDGASIGRSASNVNGAIRIEGGEVGGNVLTTNGDIELRNATVRGELRVRKPERNWTWGGERRLPRVVIGPGTVVHGPMVFEHEVELFVHATARTGPVTGATAQAFSGDEPPAR